MSNLVLKSEILNSVLENKSINRQDIIDIYEKSIKNYLLSILVSLFLLMPHFFWLFDNNFISIFYGLNRTGISDFNLINHLKNPIIFLFKQVIILIPFFIILFVLVKKLKIKINKNDQSTLYLLFINLVPISFL